MPPRRRNRNQDRQEDEIPHNEREVTPPPPPRRIEEMFLRQNPPSFNGTGTPSDAELWVRAMERIFNFLHCNAQERLSCVTFQLTGAADYWWEAKRKTFTPEQLENFSWEDFKAGLYEKYIPKSYKRKKEMEFYHLKQGKTTVTEYDRAFCDMSRYAPQQVDTEEKMSEKFCSGLRSEIRMSLAGHGQMTYGEALSRALDIEAAMPEERIAPAQFQQAGDRGKRKWEGNAGPYQQQRRPWQGNTAPQWRNQQQQQGQGQGKQVVPKQNVNAPRMSFCPKCQKYHHDICLAGSGACYRCGQEGHIARNCMNPNQEGNRRVGQPIQAKPLRAMKGEPQRQQQQSGQQSKQPQGQYNQLQAQRQYQVPQPQKRQVQYPIIGTYTTS